ncbi:malto-oligosyltrehalose trehalohydrolase [Neolewinella antarctica]|uniref:Malto-oligosyltrehalose trehalohydrolase n=1 Tax=Neolewinella antarctica TaxID=442734 RepID=A0ABX0XDJ5_9BACT|nr:malto-oligosyltrehalose trehalohydrolase [Neolewinella antarctica]NJC27006.1 maltooligosyltrehalose trehalohydrolase [Neolewinella antarctica]
MVQPQTSLNLKTFPSLPLGPQPPDAHAKRRFRVWAPKPSRIELIVAGNTHQLQPEGHGYFISDPIPAPAGTRYHFRLNDDDKVYPDPAGRYLPDGVHGASEVVDIASRLLAGQVQSFSGLALDEAVIYELHIGTFTEAGTFEAAEAKLDYLKDLGVNCLELMPLAQTPGDRNWGYDVVAPFAISRAYGGPTGLKKFIDAAHERGIAVLIDVIYNHLGPEGNYLPAFMPVFTEAHHTPWGSAINFDRAGSDGVRNYFLQNVRMWLEEYGADGLRLDAVHAIVDDSAEHFLASLSAEADRIGEEQNRKIILLAECDLNAPRFITPKDQGGYGLTGQWVDEFHHALHALLTGEQNGYYEDFGSLEQLAAALRAGYVYTGQYSRHRQRNFGIDPAAHGLRPGQFTVFLQNHDQVGNRMIGDRLSTSLAQDKYLLAAATYLFSPFVPMIWMGEEYGETRPFPYFVHHGDEPLIEAVRKGRAAEFKAFQRPGLSVPDPQAEATFTSAKLSWPEESPILAFYRTALHLRPRPPKSFDLIEVDLIKNNTDDGGGLTWTWKGWNARAYANFTDEPMTIQTGGNILLSNNDAKQSGDKMTLPAYGFALVSKT